MLLTKLKELFVKVYGWLKPTHPFQRNLLNPRPDAVPFSREQQEDEIQDSTRLLADEDAELADSGRSDGVTGGVEVFANESGAPVNRPQEQEVSGTIRGLGLTLIQTHDLEDQTPSEVITPAMLAERRAAAIARAQQLTVGMNVGEHIRPESLRNQPQTVRPRGWTPRGIVERPVSEIQETSWKLPKLEEAPPEPKAGRWEHLKKK